MKAILSAKYETGKQSSATISVDNNIGNAKLTTSVNDVIIGNDPLSYDVSFTIKKPNSFSINCIPKKDIKFQFINSITVLTKVVNMTYTHDHPANRTAVTGSVDFNSASKMVVGYTLGTGDCKLRYRYVKGEQLKRQVVVEMSYDVKKDAWDLAVTGRFEGRDVIRAMYLTTSKVLGLEWSRDSRDKGRLKVSASFNLTERKLAPKIMAESTCNYDI